MSPEEKAREVIDRKLHECGYVVQDVDEFNPKASLGVVVREWQTSSGPCDYLILIGGRPCGIIEAKAHNKGEQLTTVAEQTRRYAESSLKYAAPDIDIRFAYEATDVLTRFCDYHDLDYRSREVYSFHRPEQLQTWLNDSDTLRNRMRTCFPPLDKRGYRDCQYIAINALEGSFARNRPKALVQMATGAGKTYMAVSSTYRLLKFANAKRILFLVDTTNLGEQTEAEFKQYHPSDDPRLFPELYNICRLTSSSIPNGMSVCISTIQRMYSILHGKRLTVDEENDITSEEEDGKPSRIREVKYNPSYPPEYFDFIIVDECHRSIYNVWKQVLDYFDAFIIGLTATPDKRTFAFFDQNVVSEYSHELAVVDGVNVTGEVYRIETKIGEEGATITEPVVEKRDRLSREKRWEQEDEEISYDKTDLDKDVVNPSEIRTCIREFRDRVTTVMFPGRKEVPKTLIFAKTDSHADDIINIVREEFGKGNEFCKKVTYRAKDDPKSTLNAFRNDYNPRIAVTVDMIATGTDVKPLECLIFMRDVRSKNFFEQMLGRGRRTLAYDDLVKVTPSATNNKEYYVVVDCVGVTTSLKTDRKSFDRKPTVDLKTLLTSVAMGARDDDTLTTLAGRLLRLEAVMTDDEKAKSTELAGGIPVNQIAKDLLDAFDPDVIEERAQHLGTSPEEAQAALIDAAVQPIFNPDLRKFLIDARKSHDQIIDNENLDHVTFSGWNEDREDNARKTVQTLKQFIEDNKDELEALQIIYNESYRMRPLTLRMIKEVHEALKQEPYHTTCDQIWHAYEVLKTPGVTHRSTVGKLMDIVSVIRFALGQQKTLRPFDADVAEKFKQWMFEENAGSQHFSDEQVEWLRDIRDHVATSGSITADDLDLSPFGEKGGLGRFYLLFGGNYQRILDEANYRLVA